MNEELINRIKSFAWRFAAYVIMVALAWLADNIGLLQLNPTITAVLALVLGELSKAWANREGRLGRTYLGRKKA